MPDADGLPTEAEIEGELMKLVDAGMLTMSIGEDGFPLFKMTDLGKQTVEEMLKDD